MRLNGKKIINVTAAIIEKDGLIFAARRKAGNHLEGHWEFPGGKLEEGETPEECLKRELFEEFSIVCTIGDYFGESTYEYQEKAVRLLCYFVSHQSGKFRCSDHDLTTWLPPAELPALHWAPADIPLMENLVTFKTK